MRIFILPSWCPTRDEPLSGTFFVEQAEAIARSRPEWTVAFCSFDLARSRIPWRPHRIPRFLKDYISTPPMSMSVTPSGLHEYKVWAPYFPRFGPQKWRANTEALGKQVRPALADFIRRFGVPDIIHARAVYPGGAAAVALGREFNIPVGITEHIGPFPGKQLSLSDGRPIPLITETYAKAARHSADGSELAERIIALGLSKHVDVIPNFLSDSFGFNQTSLAKNNTAFSFLSVGGPSYAKGTDVLLNAFARLKEHTILSVAGSGAEFPVFREMADNLGISRRVRWLGGVARSEMSRHFQECDAFVLPSRGENFGVVYIEALAHGKPLVATYCGGPEDIVTPSNGLLVPVGDVGALSNAMQYMMHHVADYDPPVLQEDFRARFSATSVVSKFEQWYRTIIDGRHRSTVA
ncbi:MAG: glycosyltransferase [Nitrospirota bacterium]